MNTITERHARCADTERKCSNWTEIVCILITKLWDYFYGLDGESKKRYMQKLSFKDKTWWSAHKVLYTFWNHVWPRKDVHTKHEHALSSMWISVRCWPSIFSIEHYNGIFGRNAKNLACTWSSTASQNHRPTHFSLFPPLKSNTNSRNCWFFDLLWVGIILQLLYDCALKTSQHVPLHPMLLMSDISLRFNRAIWRKLYAALYRLECSSCPPLL